MELFFVVPKKKNFYDMLAHSIYLLVDWKCGLYLYIAYYILCETQL